MRRAVFFLRRYLVVSIWYLAHLLKLCASQFQHLDERMLTAKYQLPNASSLLQSQLMFTRPPGFTYKNDELHCDALSLNGLAKKFGTPLYLYSATALRQRYR